MTISTIYNHDCDKCDTLGIFDEHDLYFCKQNSIMPTVIARFGNGGSEYKSGLALAPYDKHLMEAYLRAIRKNLIQEVF